MWKLYEWYDRLSGWWRLAFSLLVIYMIAVALEAENGLGKYAVFGFVFFLLATRMYYRYKKIRITQEKKDKQ